MNMTIETLNDRLSKANDKVAKKLNTIAKKTALMEKKQNQITKMDDEREIYGLKCDIKWLQDDINRLNDEIKETKKTITKYEAQLSGEIEKESIFLKDIPESMKAMQTELVEVWDEFDMGRRNTLRAEYFNLGYSQFIRKYSYYEYELISKTDEEIHNSNMKDAKALIINLYYRVRNITGEVTDWSNICAEQGTHGFTVLNGIVIGKEGKAKVESILAGGYNIQRLHIRVLVHSI